MLICIQALKNPTIRRICRGWVSSICNRAPQDRAWSHDLIRKMSRGNCIDEIIDLLNNRIIGPYVKWMPTPLTNLYSVDYEQNQKPQNRSPSTAFPTWVSGISTTYGSHEPYSYVKDGHEGNEPSLISDMNPSPLSKQSSTPGIPMTLSNNHSVSSTETPHPSRDPKIPRKRCPQLSTTSNMPRHKKATIHEHIHQYPGPEMRGSSRSGRSDYAKKHTRGAQPRRILPKPVAMAIE